MAERVHASVMTLGFGRVDASTYDKQVSASDTNDTNIPFVYSNTTLLRSYRCYISR